MSDYKYDLWEECRFRDEHGLWAHGQVTDRWRDEDDDEPWYEVLDLTRPSDNRAEVPESGLR